MFAHGLYRNSNTTHTHQPVKHHHNRFTNNGQDFSAIADPTLDTETEYAVDNDEDDDAHNFMAEKFRLMARSHATHAYPAYPSILDYFRNSFNAAPSFCGQVSHKYILQGVLRI
jgi:hypothetical protein